MTLINITKNDKKPIYIDPSDVTALSVYPEKKELALYNSKGRLVWTGLTEDLDPAYVVQKLAENGRPLIYFPTRWTDGKEYPLYISPEAVQYATVSTVSKDGKAGIIFGVEGLGREESYGTTQAELETFLKAVRAVKTLREYAPEEACSRWASPGALYIDPKSVTQIRDDGYQVVVCFGQYGILAGLDVQTQKGTDVDVIANEIYDPADKNPDLKAIFREAHRRHDEEESRMRMKFANDLAAANGTLISIPAPDRATHIRKEDIGYISFHDDEKTGRRDLNIEIQASSGSSSAVYLCFKTDEERLKAFEALSRAASQSPQKKPAAFRPGPYM